MVDKPAILTVDDRPENLLALRTVLAPLDVRVVEASNGNDALAATLTQDFAVAILDVQMPGMDGYELAELLRGDPKTERLPIVFLTAAYGEEENVFRGYEAGAVDYIVKPYNPVVLRSKVSAFLELHRRAEALADKVDALAESEERFRTLVMTIPDIVYRLDPDGHFTFLNNAVTALGYTPEELIGRHFTEILSIEDVPRVSRAEVLPRYKGRTTGPDGAPKLFDERRTGDRQTRELEVCLIHRTGQTCSPGLLQSLSDQVVVVEVNSSGLYSPVPGRGAHVFVGTVGVIRDITERKQVQQELDRHRKHLEELVEARIKEQSCLFRISKLLVLPHGSFSALLSRVIDYIPSGWRYHNVACARISLDGSSACTKNFVETPWRLAAGIVSGGAVRGSVEVFYTELPKESLREVFIPEEGELIGAIGRLIGQAVERQEAVRGLEETENRYRALLDRSNDLIYVHDFEGRFLDANRAALERTGYTLDEVRSMSFADLLSPDQLPLAFAALNEVVETGSQAHATEFRLAAKDGSVIVVETKSAVILNGGRPVAIQGVARDLTDRRKAEEERLRLQAQLAQSQRLESIGTLASGVAHEINNPLNVVMNFAQLILDDAACSGPAREFAAGIVDESERMATIVRNLLAFSRADKEAHSPADLPTLVGGTLSLVRASLRKDGIELVERVAEGLPSVRCRSQQVQQVLMNLLTNARDALNVRYPRPAPGKVIRISADAFERDGKPWVRMTVEDQGCGIPPEVGQRMFDPFFTTKPKDKGTGLGLSISYGIVKDHGGELRYESVPDAGTRFHVELPVDSGWTPRSGIDPDGRKGG